MNNFRKFANYFIFSLLFCSLTIPVFAQADLISYPDSKIMGFRGLDTRSTAPSIQDGRATDLNNVKLSSAFDLQKRAGKDTINNTLDDLDIDSPAITGIFDSKFSDGSSKTLVFVGSKLKYDNSGTWTTVSGTATITTGQNNQWQCIMALDSAVCTNDTDVPIKVNSTPTKSVLNVSDLSDTLTKVKTLTWFRNYLIFGNTLENSVERPTRFRWSNVGTIETYTNDDFSDISTFAGDEIIGFAELYSDIYIFLKKSIWRASLTGGDEVFVFSKVIDGIGAVSRDSIQVVQLFDNRSAVIFTDDRKKVLMFDGSSITDIGSIIQPTLDNLNESRLQYSVSTFDGKSYLLSASTSGITTNDILLEFQTEIFEWTKHDTVDANAIAQVQETDLKIKSYVGNYNAFVYWLDNPELENDVDGATGIIDSVGTLDTDTITGAQVIVDSALTAGDYTGAVIKITSGTGAAQERVIAQSDSTSVTVTAAFTTTPDSTSIYSIGAIEADYQSKWYDLGDSAREKTFLGLLFWAEEASSDEATIGYAIDFDTTLDSETKSLAPTSSSLWDTALWDVGTWGTTGNKIYTTKSSGLGNFISYEFSNDDIDESFHIYGFNILAVAGDIKQ